VRLVQLGLSRRGVDIRGDGIFGQGCAGCIHDFQVAQGIAATGTADIALIAALVA
jgi:chitosanase